MSIERKIHNKKIETSITFVNALAVGSFAGGLIKPLIDYAGGAFLQITAMHTGLLLTGILLHIMARSLADLLLEE